MNRRQLSRLMLSAGLLSSPSLAAGLISIGGRRATAATLPARLETLSQNFSGVLIQPGDPQYDYARTTASFNPRFDRRPALIAACRNETDIRRALAFGQDTGLDIAVRSGGHDVLAASTCDGGLVIDLSLMDGVAFDTASATTLVQAGARAGHVTAALAPHGHVPVLGCNGNVGVSGLTLGGGLGWFIARFGATCDTVTGARVLTAGGDMLNVSAQEQPDLFWALRGGGGNFGIVTKWRYRVFPQEDIISGVLIYSGDHVQDFLAFYRDTLAAAPDTLTAELIGLNRDQNRSEPLIVASFCYSGDIDKAEQVFAPWRAFHGLLADGLTRRKFHELEQIPDHIAAFFAPSVNEAPAGPAAPGSYWQGLGLEAIGDKVIRELTNIVANAPQGASWGLGHMQRGKCLTANIEGSPFIRRQGATSLQFNAAWQQAAQADPLMTWVDRSIALMDPFAGAADYINYLSTDDPARIRKTYGGTYNRLATLKRRYDPENMFRRNRNIVPS